MNVRLLQRVRRAIASQPERFCAAHWAFARNTRAVLNAGARPQGFRCCIAGHVLLEGGACDEEELLCRGGFHAPGHLWQRAAEVAGLDRAQRTELFFPSQWDAPFKKQYYLCGRDEEANVCAAHIDHFLEKHAASGRGLAPDRRPQARAETRRAPAEAALTAAPGAGRR